MTPDDENRPRTGGIRRDRAVLAMTNTQEGTHMSEHHDGTAHGGTHQLDTARLAVIDAFRAITMLITPVEEHGAGLPVPIGIGFTRAISERGPIRVTLSSLVGTDGFLSWIECLEDPGPVVLSEYSYVQVTGRLPMGQQLRIEAPMGQSDLERFGLIEPLAARSSVTVAELRERAQNVMSDLGERAANTMRGELGV
jgi:hypothetical protein